MAKWMHLSKIHNENAFLTDFAISVKNRQIKNLIISEPFEIWPKNFAELILGSVAPIYVILGKIWGGNFWSFLILSDS